MFLSLLRKKAAAEEKPRLRAPKPLSDGGPPLTKEELTGNLTELQNELTKKMQCPNGRGQVFIRSLVLPGGTTPPRIALKCQLRRDIKQPAEMFLEDIRSVCCANHENCEAYKAFKKRHVKT